MPKISDLPAAPTLAGTDEAAFNQSGVTRRGSVSQFGSAIEGDIDHTAIQNIGVNSHTTIDAHLADLANPHAVTKTQVGLGNVENLKVNLTAIVVPTVNNDDTEGYAVGSRWIDTVTDSEFVAVDVTTGAAVWRSTVESSIARFVVNMAGNSSTTYSPYASTALATNGNGFFSLIVPSDFGSINECLVYGIPASTAAGLDIDIIINFSAPGEAYNANSASDLVTTYSVTSLQTFTLDFTAILSGVSAGDQVGFEVDHNSIGQTINYTSLVFKYNRM